MAVAEGGGHPIRALLIDPECIVAVPLSVDTVAQIVRLLDEHLIQISDVLPRGLHAAIARHITEAHTYECITRACPQARQWARVHEIPARRASLPA